MLDHYEIVKFIASGGLGEVYHVIRKEDSKEGALKVFKNTDHKRSVFENEIKVMREMNHELFVKYYDHSEDEKSLYIFMEYVPGRDLFYEIVGRVKLNVKEILKQVITGMMYIHENGYILMDLKVENLIHNSGKIKFIDFGAFSKIGSDFTHGSVDYLPPEYHNNELYLNDVSIDLWCLGILTYILLFKGAPFEQDSSKFLSKIKKASFSFPKEAKNDEKDFINKLLVLDRRQRMSLSEALSHEFLQ